MKSKSRSCVIAALFFASIGCNISTPPPIVIGHVSDKTRADKAGDQAELGIRLALHDLSKDGALADTFGGRKIEVHHTDARGDLDKFESEAVRLDSVNKCLALFGGHSKQEAAALNYAKVPLLTFHGQPVSGASNQVFYLGMSPAEQGAILAKVAADNGKTNRVILLADERRPEPLTLSESFQKAWAAARKHADAKSQAVLVVRFGKDTVMKDLCERIQSFGPHAIVFAGAVQDFNAWHNAFRKEVFVGNAEIIYAGDDGDQRLFDFDGSDKTSVLLATAFYADPANDKTTAFTKAFREAFQTEADVHAALAYDGLRILVESMKRTTPQLTSDRQREELLTRLREELLKTNDFEGLTGPLTITPDRQVLRPLFVMRWQRGTLTAIKAFPVEKRDKEK